MYGVTQSESFHLLNAATLQFGLTETERNRIIRTYVRNSYASNIDQVTAAILNEYTVRIHKRRRTIRSISNFLYGPSPMNVFLPLLFLSCPHCIVRTAPGRIGGTRFEGRKSIGIPSWRSLATLESWRPSSKWLISTPPSGSDPTFTSSPTRRPTEIIPTYTHWWINFPRT